VIEEPENTSILVTERFEGDSTPDDEAILLALACRCGSRGPRADATVLERLSQPKDSTDG